MVSAAASTEEDALELAVERYVDQRYPDRKLSIGNLNPLDIEDTNYPRLWTQVIILLEPKDRKLIQLSVNKTNNGFEAEVIP